MSFDPSIASLKWPTAGLLVSLATTWGLTPVVRRLALTRDIMDKPGPLKPQSAPVAYLGGLAIFAGLFVGLCVVSYLQPGLPARWAIAFLAGGAAMAAGGLRDDITGISPYARLALELVVGLAFVLWIKAPWPLAACLCFLFAVGCNAMNLIDGQDGLASSLAAVFGLGGIVLGLSQGDWGMSILGATLLGSCLGFLKFNWNPASILMGDCGSLLLGFWVSGMTAYWILGHVSLARGVQMALLFAFPLIDMSLAVVRRLVRGQNAFEGDRDHLYDVLGRSRLGIVGSVVVCLAVASLLACVAVGLPS